MFVIILSIFGFTIASVPTNREWVDVWAHKETTEIIAGSRRKDEPVREDVFLSDGARRVCDEVDESRWPFRQIEAFCIIIFTIEYFVRLVASPAGPGVVRFVLGAANIIDVVSVLPFYIELILALAGVQQDGLNVLGILRLIRLSRVTRIFKMSKNFQGLIVLARTLKKSVSALLMLTFFMSILSVLSATLIFTVEQGTYDVHRKQYVRPDGSASPFENIPASMWWTIVTMTTVGYGDHVPITEAGKVIAIVTMFCGLIVLSLPITIIGANFDEEYRNMRRKEAEIRALKKANVAKEAAKVAGGQAASTKRSDDPIKQIQDLIHKSHVLLNHEVETLMVKHENQMRAQIKEILALHASNINDSSPTPLEVMRKVPEAEGGIDGANARKSGLADN